MQRIATPPTGNYKPSLVGIEPASWLFHALLSMSATEVTLKAFWNLVNSIKSIVTTNSCVYGMGDAGRSYVHVVVNIAILGKSFQRQSGTNS